MIELDYTSAYLQWNFAYYFDSAMLRFILQMLI